MSHPWTMAQGGAALVGEIVQAHGDVMRGVRREDRVGRRILGVRCGGDAVGWGDVVGGDWCRRRGATGARAV